MNGIVILFSGTMISLSILLLLVIASWIIAFYSWLFTGNVYWIPLNDINPRLFWGAFVHLGLIIGILVDRSNIAVDPNRVGFVKTVGSEE